MLLWISAIASEKALLRVIPSEQINLSPAVTKGLRVLDALFTTSFDADKQLIRFLRKALQWSTPHTGAVHILSDKTSSSEMCYGRRSPSTFQSHFYRLLKT